MIITEQLRQAADCAPLWRSIFEAAADEMDRLKEDNNKIRGRMHDQWINQNKVKADAVRDAADKTIVHRDSGFCLHCELLGYANKLERGDV